MWRDQRGCTMLSSLLSRRQRVSLSLSECDSPLQINKFTCYMRVLSFLLLLLSHQPGICISRCNIHHQLHHLQFHCCCYSRCGGLTRWLLYCSCVGGSGVPAIPPTPASYRFWGDTTLAPFPPHHQHPAGHHHGHNTIDSLLSPTILIIVSSVGNFLPFTNINRTYFTHFPRDVDNK